MLSRVRAAASALHALKARPLRDDGRAVILYLWVARDVALSGRDIFPVGCCLHLLGYILTRISADG